MTSTEAARALAERRHQLVREPIIRKACAMREAMNMPPHPGLALVLTDADRIHA